MRLPKATKALSMGVKKVVFYDYRAHCRAIGHALRMKLAAAWVALAKQLQCGQWKINNHRATFRATLTINGCLLAAIDCQ
jgi:hypothetical protein